MFNSYICYGGAFSIVGLLIIGLGALTLSVKAYFDERPFKLYGHKAQAETMRVRIADAGPPQALILELSFHGDDPKRTWHGATLKVSEHEVSAERYRYLRQGPPSRLCICPTRQVLYASTAMSPELVYYSSSGWCCSWSQPL